MSKILADTVVLIYKICGYETSWNKYFSSPWCLGFDDVSIKVSVVAFTGGCLINYLFSSQRIKTINQYKN